MILKTQPKSSLTDDEALEIFQYLGKISIDEIAEKLGTSRANLRRWARDNGISFKYTGYSEATVRAVVKFYEKHGLPETRKKFPEVKVRSIVERYGGFSPRCLKWTDEQLVELVKLSCFFSFEDQAKYFNRPRANAGSIVSAWQKKLKVSTTEVHGMCHHKAKLFIDNSCPFIELPFIVNTASDHGHRKLHLWVDLEKHLLPDCPRMIRDSVKTMSMFQRWLWKTEDIHGEIEFLRTFISKLN